MTKNMDIDLLREAVTYNPETGELTWLERPEHHFPSARIRNCVNTRLAGKPAFAYRNLHGYLMGCLGQQKVGAHRAAFALMTGRWPEQIDHINGDTTDNRWVNLREVSVVENARNAARSKRNKSGCTGVRWNAHAKAWVAFIRADGRNLHLGTFAAMDAAVAARAAAERKFNFHDNHGRAKPRLRAA